MHSKEVFDFGKAAREAIEHELEERRSANIRIKYLADIEEITQLSQGDWIDLCVSEDVIMNKGEFKLLPLGIAMELPHGYEAIVAPRSSTFKRYKILMANSIGVVDEAYHGNGDMWYFPAYATENITIAKGTRICQFRIIEHQPKITFTEVDDLGNEDRGGIGSTGT